MKILLNITEKTLELFVASTLGALAGSLFSTFLVAGGGIILATYAASAILFFAVVGAIVLAMVEYLKEKVDSCQKMEGKKKEQGTKKTVSIRNIVFVFVLFLAAIAFVYLKGYITYSDMVQTLIQILIALIAVLALLSNVQLQKDKDVHTRLNEQLNSIYVPLKLIEDFMPNINEHQLDGTQVNNTMKQIQFKYLILAEEELRKYLEEYYVLTRNKTGFVTNKVRIDELLPKIRDAAKRDYETIMIEYTKYYKE